MHDYSGKTTAELIDLLFKEEDRVTEAHLRELIGRGEEAAAPLREILANEDYWYEGVGGEHFVVLHAVNALGAMRNPQALPLMLEILEHAYFANHDWGVEMFPAALASYGEAAVEPLIAYIDRTRGWHRDNQDWAYCRNKVASALTRIALDHESVRDRVRDFILERYNDPEENDYVFLSFSAACPFVLGHDRGIQALKNAYTRRAISPTLVGTYRELLSSVNDPTSGFYDDLQSDLLDFYQPEEIRHREKQRREAPPERLYWGHDDASLQAGAPARADNKVGRNDPCPCGSGKKYKKCCGA